MRLPAHKEGKYVRYAGAASLNNPTDGETLATTMSKILYLYVLWLHVVRACDVFVFLRFTSRPASRRRPARSPYSSGAYMKNRLRVSRIACRMEKHERCIEIL